MDVCYSQELSPYLCLSLSMFCLSHTYPNTHAQIDGFEVYGMLIYWFSSFFFTFSLSYSYRHTHNHTHTYIHTLRHMHTHTHRHTHTHPLPHTHMPATPSLLPSFSPSHSCIPETTRGHRREGEKERRREKGSGEGWNTKQKWIKKHPL